MDKISSDQLTWVLSKARSYALAVCSFREPKDVMITLDTWGWELLSRNIAWLCEIPSEHVCSMPVKGEWRCYVHEGALNYYRDSVSHARNDTCPFLLVLHDSLCSC
ncbi:hypothetical protein KFL_007780120 [Klebsormidium nitens]|uniref:Uncharacterized protein n=1 Tax=Klebsormidium nitens TaxID=105231 RepID=A0A1Y1IKK3_KLENI|nr:hypothetical protein KFL_007780120 [Klebsormidium nitens]|eukprot:GAQ91405.1 hypothetical protein KFL_007780120 [Klebsormidium nitens]